jgi:hypothetical protein
VFGRRGRASLRRQGNEIRVDRPLADPDYPGYRYLRPSAALEEHTLPNSFGRALTELGAAVREHRMPAVAPETYVGSLLLVERILAQAGTKGTR